MMKKLFKAEGGFTLVELLVTIAILAVLFGVVTLSLSGIGSDAEDTVNAAELGVVQSAFDILIAEKNLSTGASGDISAQNDCTHIDSDTTVATYSIGDYLREETLTGAQTKCGYTWDVNGVVTQDSTNTCVCSDNP
jgi:prepilin-type N-terminal cleavage/methylation domain-containing protein